ncbi:hypothetical protein LPJ53_006203, partial [Coemansia erecta]
TNVADNPDLQSTGADDSDRCLENRLGLTCPGDANIWLLDTSREPAVHQHTRAAHCRVRSEHSGTEIPQAAHPHTDGQHDGHQICEQAGQHSKRPAPDSSAP